VLGLGKYSSAERFVLPSFFANYAASAQSDQFFSLCFGPEKGHLILGGTNTSYKNRFIGSFNYDPAILKASTILIGNGMMGSFFFFAILFLC
jgi:hypothetical protein